MALTAGARGANQTTAAAAEELAYNGAIAGSTLCVRCRGGATSPAMVRIPRLHGATPDAGAVVLQGEREYFRVGHGDLGSAFIGGVGGVTTVDWYLVAETR